MSNISLGSICILWLTTSILFGYMIIGTCNMSGFKFIGIPYIIFMSGIVHLFFLLWIGISCANQSSSEK